jgi:AcrR family transcriptional regulator
LAVRGSIDLLLLPRSTAIPVGLPRWYRYAISILRQDPSLKNGTRTNQKARTRAALLQAATELFREGKSPSMPEAADRALVSVATAYRYFSSVEDLWWEATQAAAFQQTFDEALERTKAAGPDPQARLEAAIRSNSFAMIDDPVPFRRVAQIALEQWFRQREAADGQRIPNGRNVLIGEVLGPLAGTLSEQDLHRIANALGLVLGTEAMIAQTDGVGLDAPTVKDALLDAGRWLLAGALAELADSVAPTD